MTDDHEDFPPIYDAPQDAGHDFPRFSRKPPAAAKLDEEVTVTIYTFSNCIHKLYRTQLKSPKEIADLGRN